MPKLSCYRRIVNLEKKLKTLELYIEDSNFVKESDLTNNVISVTANQPFPDSWTINNGDLDDLISDINNDETATKGKIYLSTVTLNDLPAGMRQAELKVEILEDTGKIIFFTITSEDTAPYHWEATSAYGRSATWRSFVNN